MAGTFWILGQQLFTMSALVKRGDIMEMASLVFVPTAEKNSNSYTTVKFHCEHISDSRLDAVLIKKNNFRRQSLNNGLELSYCLRS